MDKKNAIKSFPKKHPILFHLLLIMVVFFVLLYATLCVIDSFTGHGEYVNVPNVKGLALEDAVQKLSEAGFKWEVTDSAYNETYKPGAVIDQEPKEDSRVKPLRTIYITMNAKSPREVVLPYIVDMSYRQGTALLEGLGFKKIEVEEVYSPYKDLILEVKVNGKPMTAGMRLPVTARIEMKVGNGAGEELPDSIEAEFDDSIALFE